MLALLLCLPLCPLPSASGHGTETPTEPFFVLPASVQVIEEDAFAGTAVRIAVFQDGIRRIDSNAFAGAAELSDVYIPASVGFIADSAFGGNDRLVLHGIAGSYAEEWAHAHEIAFSAADIWTDFAPPDSVHIEMLPVLFWLVCPVDDKLLRRLERIGRTVFKSMRPQDRPELNPIDYRFP